MKHHYLHKENHPKLTLFFAGWGMDEHPFTDYRSEDSDLLLCYDYRSLFLDSSLMQGYNEIKVVGWSMGVWAAGQVLQHFDLPITESIAVNGTPMPVDDEQGIPSAIFQGTLEGLDERNLRKFYRRMCGDTAATEAFLQRRPTRPIDELKEELNLIGSGAATLPRSTFIWTKAMIGTDDRIFSAANQQQAWSNTSTQMVTREIPHYHELMLRKVITNSHTEEI